MRATIFFHSTDELHRRAGGRRRYNAERQRAAWARRKAIIEAIGEGTALLSPHGIQTALAERFGVNRSTICRDIAAIRKAWRDPRRCAVCGDVFPMVTMKQAVKLAKRGLWDRCTANECAKLSAAILGRPAAKPIN